MYSCQEALESTDRRNLHEMGTIVSGHTDSEHRDRHLCCRYTAAGSLWSDHDQDAKNHIGWDIWYSRTVSR